MGHGEVTCGGAVMALYSGKSTMVRTCAGDSSSFEVKVGFHWIKYSCK